MWRQRDVRIPRAPSAAATIAIASRGDEVCIRNVTTAEKTPTTQTIEHRPVTVAKRWKGILRKPETTVAGNRVPGTNRLAAKAGTPQRCASDPACSSFRELRRWLNHFVWARAGPKAK